MSLKAVSQGTHNFSEVVGSEIWPSQNWFYSMKRIASAIYLRLKDLNLVAGFVNPSLQISWLKSQCNFRHNECSMPRNRDIRTCKQTDHFENVVNSQRNLLRKGERWKHLDFLMSSTLFSKSIKSRFRNLLTLQSDDVNAQDG